MPVNKKIIPRSLENKLLKILMPENENIIVWNKEGNGFIIKDIKTFIEKILPAYFKTNKIESFIRHINYYGFQKYNCDSYSYRSPFFNRYKKECDVNIVNNHKKRFNEMISKRDLLIKENKSLKTILNEKDEELNQLKDRFRDLEQRLLICSFNHIDEMFYNNIK